MSKQMTSKFPGKCRDCASPVAEGALIAYHGRGRGISCAKCAGLESETAAASRIVAPCWECKAPEGKFRAYGAATPVYCDACEATIRARQFKVGPVRFDGPDRFDMDYEDRCAEACGL